MNDISSTIKKATESEKATINLFLKKLKLSNLE